MCRLQMATPQGGPRDEVAREGVRLAIQAGAVSKHHATGATRVRDAMAKTICTARGTDTIERIARMMKDEDCGFVPITADGRVVGVITDRDIVMWCVTAGHAETLQATAADVMSTDVCTVDADDTLDHAADLMAQRRVRRLPVVEHGNTIGVLSHGNLVQALIGLGPALRATLAVTEGA
jgi:CBS domain-containing protein